MPSFSEPQKAQKIQKGFTKGKFKNIFCGSIVFYKNFQVMRKVTKGYLKDLTYQVNGAAIEVHKALGPGLLESVYHKCLKQELTLRNIKFQSESDVPVFYKGIELDTNFRCDLLIEDCLVLELKTVDAIIPIHEAQLLTYMKLLKMPKEIIYNFKVVNLYKDGQRTFVNEFFRDLPN